MPKKLSTDIDIQLVRAYFKGWKRDETASKCNTSGGTVSDRWASLENLMGPEGKNLRDLSIQMQNNGITALQASTGARIISTLTSLDIDEDRFQEFASSIYQASIDHERQPEQVVKNAIYLTDLEDQSGLTYDQIIRNCEEKIEEATKLENKIGTLKDEASVARKYRDMALQEKDTTLKTLAEYTNIRGTLKTYGQDIENTSKLSNMLTNAEEQGYDAINISKHISSIENLAERHEELQEETKTLEEKKNNQEHEIGELTQDIATKENKLQEITQYYEKTRRQEKNMRETLEELEHLTDLDETLKKHNITITRLDNIIEQGQNLEESGFTSKTAEILASALTKIGLDPQNAATTLTTLLAEHKSLEQSVSLLQAESSKLQRATDAKKLELIGIIRQEETTRAQLNAFRKQVDEYKQLIKGQEEIHNIKIKQLENEYNTKSNKLTALYNEQMQKLEKEYTAEKARGEEDIRTIEVRRGALADEIQTLQDKNTVIQASLSEAEATLKKIDERLSEKKPLRALACLMEEPTSPIESTLLLKATISIVEGLKAHLKANLQIVSNPYKLIRHLEDTSRILTEALKFAA